MDTNELWQAALGELELKLSKANFTTWFKSTFVALFSEGLVTIGVPNTFTKAWLEKKYHKDITMCLQSLSGNAIKSVIYRVETRPGTPQIIPTVEEMRAKRQEDAYADIPSFTPVYKTSGPIESGFGSSRYTFGNFVVGKQNELAHAAAQAVASQPGGAYNPLFVYGGVGLGKTHLLQAIGHEIRTKNPRSAILYVTCERFTNEFIDSVRSGKAAEFKDRYRNVDVLLVDDIQFITSKERTQEEFFHTFNHLHQNNKQVVITSDRPPKAIVGLEQRLVSRLGWGMLADIGNPDYETRMAILETKMRERNYLFDRDILHHISNAITNNVRELEGALNKIVAYHQFKNIRPTIESVQGILATLQPIKNIRSLTPRHILETVSTYYDLAIDDLLGKSREKRLAYPRQIVMYLLRQEMKSSYPSIGASLGGRDHTTAMHAFDKISGLLETDEKLKQDLEMIKQRMYTS
ncbi:chromosomal replication initiator protein DnaA [Candidatus Uhrbacteria bacterium]|nr:chromosomal replication initiator protein DnaA [Candidatus Uhrbacteria bacterium]